MDLHILCILIQFEANGSYKEMKLCSHCKRSVEHLDEYLQVFLIFIDVMQL